MNVRGPTSAVVAVTLNCNARCVMCDIWKNDMKGEMRPEEYAALPPTLKEINISGGEPFLRPDLPEVCRAIRRACPDARLVISSNGFTTNKTIAALREIVADDPKVGLRISLDGVGEKHNEIRGIPGGFERCQATLDQARGIGVTDLGIGFTVMGRNLDHVRPLYEFAEKRGLQFSVTMATSSDIYFGADQERHRPEASGEVERELGWLVNQEYRHAQPKRWFRAWFEGRLLRHYLDGKRPLPCDAGRGFVYIDSHANVYACQIRSLEMGNLRKQPWREIWASAEADHARAEAGACHQCWMICTARTAMREHLARVGVEAVAGKVRAHLPG